MRVLYGFSVAFDPEIPNFEVELFLEELTERVLARVKGLGGPELEKPRSNLGPFKRHGGAQFTGFPHAET